MRSLLFKPAQKYLRGKVVLPGDKSIAHRSVIISAISRGKTSIKNFPASIDCLSTVKACKKLGIKITRSSRSDISVSGRGLHGLKKPKGPIFAGDSGTTLRLILGVLAGQDFSVALTGGKSLSQRPMLRVTAPLRLMGARIKAKCQNRQGAKGEERLPITIKGGALRPIIYRMPVASAQVKSAILFAGLYAKGATTVIEPVKTRDHTERMLRLFEAAIKVGPNKIVIKGNKELSSPGRLFIPGDISSASFFMVAASILPGSRVLIKNAGLNPSRAGILNVLKRMGARIQITNYQSAITDYEPMGDLIVRGSLLKGTIVKKAEIPSLIDELPILMVAACYARGETIFDGIQELRVKETDRIRSMSYNLTKMGAQIRVFKTAKSEKMVIRGGRGLKGASVKSFADHRTAMSMVIAALGAQGNTRIDDTTCINKSFPNFLGLLRPIICKK